MRFPTHNSTLFSALLLALAFALPTAADTGSSVSTTVDASATTESSSVNGETKEGQSAVEVHVETTVSGESLKTIDETRVGSGEQKIGVEQQVTVDGDEVKAETTVMPEGVPTKLNAIQGVDATGLATPSDAVEAEGTRASASAELRGEVSDNAANDGIFERIGSWFARLWSGVTGALARVFS